MHHGSVTTPVMPSGSRRNTGKESDGHRSRQGRKKYSDLVKQCKNTLLQVKVLHQNILKVPKVLIMQNYSFQNNDYYNYLYIWIRFTAKWVFTYKEFDLVHKINIEA